MYGHKQNKIPDLFEYQQDVIQSNCWHSIWKRIVLTYIANVRGTSIVIMKFDVMRHVIGLCLSDFQSRARLLIIHQVFFLYFLLGRQDMVTLCGCTCVQHALCALIFLSHLNCIQKSVVWKIFHRQYNRIYHSAVEKLFFFIYLSDEIDAELNGIFP